MTYFPKTVSDHVGEVSVRPTIITGLTHVADTCALNPGCPGTFQFTLPAVTAQHEVQKGRLGAVFYVLPSITPGTFHPDSAFLGQAWLDTVRHYNLRPNEERIPHFNPAESPEIQFEIAGTHNLLVPPIFVFMERHEPALEWANRHQRSLVYNKWKTHVFAASRGDRDITVYYTASNFFICQAMDNGAEGKVLLRRRSGIYTSTVQRSLLNAGPYQAVMVA